MLLPILAGATLLAVITRRPSGRSGRSVIDGPSTSEGQQNRNARRMKATRNGCGGGQSGYGECANAQFGRVGFSMIRTGGPLRNGRRIQRIDASLIPR